MPRAKLFDEKEVLIKAMNLFWKNGYYDTSAQDLVDELGISRSSLYDTFGGKKQLFEKAFQLYRDENLKAVSQLLASHKDVKVGFLALFEKAIEESKKDKEAKGCFVVNTTAELVPNDHSFLKDLQENQQKFVETFRGYLKEGVEKGQIPADKELEAIARLFYTFYSGLKIVSKVSFNEQETLQSVENLLSILD
ncbi:TetR/AcrR family transcriptional regulator [Aliifodinibius salicampi]|uniref:TetR/AcrR family transcriptional regulator n=1 Tax=Fodinibius salicampi TaxID=1920655 RepID=A0ABT3Q3C2_9BACT|nr:TetR/AcrR family transcriptional regulator [Fodinibius salicampi]MCW9714596.1 TetR/AcrR family transcriptional regulator [Fodinibius salicampi]